MNIRFTLTAFVAAASLAACSDPSGPLTSTPADVANIPPAAAKTSSVIEDAYIVTLADDEADPDKKAKDLLASIKGKGKLKHVYKHALKGFAITMSSEDAAAIADMPGVERVEADMTVSISGVDSPVKSWGLDRIDQAALPLSNTFTYASTGAGVRVYIVDTGILPNHTEFGGRATAAYNAIATGTAVDCNGHGTHVAGTVGGATMGIARSATIIGVRVLDCGGSGSISDVIEGINWVVSNKGAAPAVANMSLGGGVNYSLNDAVRNAVAAGITFAVAAGNSGADACGASPASEPSAITVGATGSTDARASYSNFGRCLDIFAPGSSIASAWHTGTSAINTISGTSMASPHVAGIAAVILGDSPSFTPAQVRSAMLAQATPNVVTSAGTSSPNLLLNNQFGTVVTPPTTTPIKDLSVRSSRNGGKTNMNLSWNPGTTGGTVAVYRSTTADVRGSLLANTANDGAYTDSRVSTAYFYTVCQGAVCTNQAKAP